MKKNSKADNVMYNIKQKPLNSKKTKIILVLAIIFAIYCTVLLIKLLANPTKTVIVEQGKIYSEESVEGYIIRDETVIETEYDLSKAIHLKSECDKVAKGEAICRNSLDNEEELNNKIAELDIKIQEALKNENAFFSSDIKLLENQIETKLSKIYESTNLKEIQENKKNINNYITKKAKIAGELSPKDSYIKQLISERSGYENQLNSGSKYLYAEKSGVISYKIDGLEDRLIQDDFEYLSKNFLNSLNLKSGQIIATSSSGAKIINNFKCNIAFVSNTEEALNCNENDYIKIRLPSSEEINARIVKKKKESEKEVLIVLEVDDNVENLVSYRKISFDVIWWSYSGIRIPNSAINYDGTASYVIRNKAGYEEKIFVKILRQNKSYSIVQNYSTSELQELGYDMNTLGSKKSIGIYDEIYVKKD